MAYRPDASDFDRPLSAEELKELQRKISMLSPGHVYDAYQRAHADCRMDGEKLPRATALQELVTAWKVLRALRSRRNRGRD